MASDASLRLEVVVNRRLAAYLAGVGLAGHLARYVVARRPDGRSLAVTGDGDIAGVAVSGIEFGLYEVPSCWLFSDRPDVIRLLVRELGVRDGAPLSFSLRHADVVRACIGDRRITVDHLYALAASHFRPELSGPDVCRLGRGEVAALDIPGELRGLIGRTADWPDDFHIHGIVEEDTLIAMGEFAVRDDQAASIQQVYTLRSRRREGLASRLVSELARILLDEGLVPAYLVDENNVPSIALAESLGFELDSRWGCVG